MLAKEIHFGLKPHPDRYGKTVQENHWLACRLRIQRKGNQVVAFNVKLMRGGHRSTSLKVHLSLQLL
jgi:hypothetical protein